MVCFAVEEWKSLFGLNLASLIKSKRYFSWVLVLTWRCSGMLRELEECGVSEDLREEMVLPKGDTTSYNLEDWDGVQTRRDICSELRKSCPSYYNFLDSSMGALPHCLHGSPAGVPLQLVHGREVSPPPLWSQPTITWVSFYLLLFFFSLKHRDSQQF